MAGNESSGGNHFRMPAGARGCLARNDLALTRTQLVGAFDTDRSALHWSRLLAGHLYEVAYFLRREALSAAIKEFATTLPSKPAQVYRELRRPDFLKGRLEGDRERIFRYPSTDKEAKDKGGPALHSALETVRDLEAALVVKWGKDGKAEDLCFDFADQVAVQFALADFGTIEAEQRKPIVAVRERAAKVIWLADAVFHPYAETVGGGLDLGEPEPLMTTRLAHELALITTRPLEQATSTPSEGPAKPFTAVRFG